MKALIIDDEIDICYLLQGILINKNIYSDYVNSISEAKHILQQIDPSIIFLDNHLPDSRGVDFISYIKKNKPGTVVIMITAYDTPDDRRKAIAEGADFFIPKPFSRDTVFSTIDKLL